MKNKNDIIKIFYYLIIIGNLVKRHRCSKFVLNYCGFPFVELIKNDRHAYIFILYNNIYIRCFFLTNICLSKFGKLSVNNIYFL